LACFYRTGEKDFLPTMTFFNLKSRTMEQIDGLEIKLWSQDETCKQDEEDLGRPLTKRRAHTYPLRNSLLLIHSHKRTYKHTHTHTHAHT